MSDADATPKAGTRIDPDVGKQVLLVMGLCLELLMMAAGLWPAAWLVLRYAPVAHAASHWVLLILAAALAFNAGYLLALLLFRAIIPRPRQGHYPVDPDGGIPRVVQVLMLNILLVKARHDPPWGKTFSSMLTSVPPLGPLFRWFFGPRTSSVMATASVSCVDPHFVEAGKNVEFGYGCIITAHHFDNRGMYIRKVTIGDHAVIGDEAALMTGVEVGHHAVVEARSLVRPDTKIGPYEYWAGMPARKIRDIRPDDAGQASEHAGP